MKKIIVEITGDAPLLMHNPEGMGRGPSAKKVIPKPEDEAKAAVYTLPNGKGMCLKADHIHRCLEIAARGFRLAARQPLGPYVTGSISISPEFIPLIAKEYEVDVRRVVVNKSGIMRARPKIWPWKALFEIHYDEEAITPEFMATPFRNEVMKKAGKAVGILDYRPKFGRFHISKWEM